MLAVVAAEVPIVASRARKPVKSRRRVALFFLTAVLVLGIALYALTHDFAVNLPGVGFGPAHSTAVVAVPGQPTISAGVPQSGPAVTTGGTSRAGTK